MPLNPRILLVDDDEVILQIVQKTFAPDYSVSTCRDALCGVDLLLAEDFDLLVIDLEMPILDGIELIRMIRQYPQFQTIPIIALSAAAHSSARLDRSQIQSLVAKPLSIAELAGALRQFVGRNRVQL